MPFARAPSVVISSISSSSSSSISSSEEESEDESEDTTRTILAFLLEEAFFVPLAAAALSDPDSVGLALFLGGKWPNEDDDALVVALALVEWSANKKIKQL